MSLFGKPADRTPEEREQRRRERAQRRAGQEQDASFEDGLPGFAGPASAPAGPGSAGGDRAGGDASPALQATREEPDEVTASRRPDDDTADWLAEATQQVVPFTVGVARGDAADTARRREPILAGTGAPGGRGAGAGGTGPTGGGGFAPGDRRLRAVPTDADGFAVSDGGPAPRGARGAGGPVASAGGGGGPGPGGYGDDDPHTDPGSGEPGAGDHYEGGELLPPQWVEGGPAGGHDDSWHVYPDGEEPYGVDPPLSPRSGLVGNPFAGELPQGLRVRPPGPRPNRMRLTAPPLSSGERVARAIKRLLAVAAVVVCAGAVWFAIKLFQPFSSNGQGTDRVTVVIPKGAGAREIGDLLAARGVVSSGFFFDVRAAIDGKRGDLHSGRYVLRHGMSYSAAISALEVPPPPPPVVRVTIPEGYSRVDTAALARADGLTGSYLVATRHSVLLDPRNYGAPSSTPDLEGFLFPATYDLNHGANVSVLVADQLTTFRQHFGAAEIRAARRLHVTPYALLTIASMIEREAQLPRDRALVAEVIYRRLRLGMALGIDSTLRYYLNDWSKPLTESQLALNTPYNTRLHTGLPPTPIGNPGDASIAAAAHPAGTHFLYYVTGGDGCGDLRFANTYAGFERLSAAYQTALANNGGRVPTCKKSAAKPPHKNKTRRSPRRRRH